MLNRGASNFVHYLYTHGTARRTMRQCAQEVSYQRSQHWDGVQVRLELLYIRAQEKE